MSIEGLTPKQIVEKLDSYIIGQDKAKRAVAVALRNRIRRIHLSEDIRDEVAPKNILMIENMNTVDFIVKCILCKVACLSKVIKMLVYQCTKVGELFFNILPGVLMIAEVYKK